MIHVALEILLNNHCMVFLQGFLDHFIYLLDLVTYCTNEEQNNAKSKATNRVANIFHEPKCHAFADFRSTLRR